ncbi:MAG: S8 family serine peptidase [Candidatus Peribacteraceae bacterium]
MSRRRILTVLIVCVCAAAAAWFFLGKGSGALRGQLIIGGGPKTLPPFDGYIVQMTEPALLERPEIATAYRAERDADRKSRVMRTAGMAAASAKGRKFTETNELRKSLTAASSASGSLHSLLNARKPRIKSQQSSVQSKLRKMLPKLESFRGAQGSTLLADLLSGTGETTTSFSLGLNGFVLPVASLSDEEKAEIESIDGVEKVFPNLRLSMTTGTSVPWIGAATVHSKNASGVACNGNGCITGAGIKIGIIDTGIDWTHADFGSCSSIGSGCKVKGGVNFLSGSSNPMDDNGHGTHVAAIAAGKTNAYGLNGVASDADIYAYKVLNEDGEGDFSHLQSALEQAIADGVDIVNLSIGTTQLATTPDDEWSAKIDNFVNAGLVIVAAAGNTGEDGFYSVNIPGAARKAISVGAVFDPGYIPSGGYPGAIISFSGRGPTNGYTVKPDIMAPGALICSAKLSSLSGSCDGSNTHMELNGTSMATPHMSGVAALMLQTHPDMTPAVLKQTLRDTACQMTSEGSCGPFSVAGILYQGYGVVQADAATFSQPYNPVRLDTAGGLSGVVPLLGSVTTSPLQYYSFKLYDGAGQYVTTIMSSTAPPSGNVLFSSFDVRSYQKELPYYLVLEAVDTAGRVSRDTTIVYNINAAIPVSSSSASYSSLLPSSSSSLSSSSIPSSSSSSAVASSSLAASSSSLASSSFASSSSQSSWIACPMGFQCTRTQSDQGGVLQCLASSLASCTPEWNGACGSPSCPGECYRCLSSSSAPSSLPQISSSARSSVASSGANVCGNGAVEPTERCDDGNRISGDGCSSTCQAECIDTDGGPDYSVRGTTRSTWRSNPLSPLRWNSKTDSCRGNVLTEFLCSAGARTKNAIAGRAVTCKRGCSNGACLR